MFDRLRKAWLILTAPVEAEALEEEKRCPNCGSRKMIDVTTVDTPVDRQQMLCGECNFTWQQELTSR